MSDDKIPSETQNSFPEETVDLSLIQRALEGASIESPDLSQLVLTQFQQDLSSPLPCQYDFEFISTYFDDQLYSDFPDQSLLKHRISAFEQHLPQCSFCNESLGQIFELTQAYRGYLYRMEDRLQAFDVAEQTITMFQSAPAFPIASVLEDDTQPLPQVGCGKTDFETLSAYLDDELPITDASALNRHLDACEHCQAMLQAFARFNLSVKGAYTHLLAQEDFLASLDLWPQIQSELGQRDFKEPVSIASHRRQKRWIPLAASAIAASLFIAVFAGRLISPLGEEAGSLSKSVNVSALEAAMLADERDSMFKQSAVLPVSATSYMYQTPEAYLFSSESDMLSEEALTESTDVSAIVLSSYY